jgi:peptide chain release factor 3
LLDDIEAQIKLRPTPVTWPVGIAGDFRGVLDRRSGDFIRFTRTARGAKAAPEEIVSAARAAAEEGSAWDHALEEAALLEEVGATLDLEEFMAGESSPLFVGSALTNFGVRHLLDAIVDFAPPPSPRPDAHAQSRPLETPFSGFVFKIQANMNPGHRDHIAFVRVCSGRFERGMTVTHEPTGKPFATKYVTSVFGADRDTIDEAYPGDVIGLVNASDLAIGDTLYAADPVRYPSIPTFAPELFAAARALDSSRYKQFRRGLEQLEQEGVIQVLRDPDGDPTPILAAVGQMQFEVFAHRLEHEFGARVELLPTPHRLARRVDEVTAAELQAVTRTKVLIRRDGALLALFENEYRLERLQADHPEWRLDPILVS